MPGVEKKRIQDRTGRRQIRYRNCMFTLNNPTEIEQEKLVCSRHDSRVTMLWAGWETAPTTGTPHLQCCARFKDKLALSTIKDILGERIADVQAIECQTGSNNAYDYCCKGAMTHQQWLDSGTDGPTFGQGVSMLVKHGKKPDPGGFRSVQETLFDSNTNKEWRTNINIAEHACKYPHWCQWQFDYRPREKHEYPGPPRPWQKYMEERLIEPADRRTIHWVYDPDGSAGKSEFTLHMVRNYGATVLSGKQDNMFHGYDNEPIILIDVPMESLDFLQYGAIEKLKDGLFFSGKYNSSLKDRGFNAHVVILANERPKGGCFSPSRMQNDLKIYDLSRTDNPWDNLFSAFQRELPLSQEQREGSSRTAVSQKSAGRRSISPSSPMTVTHPRMRNTNRRDGRFSIRYLISSFF